MGQRRRFAREFKLEAVKLVRERGVSVAQVSRDLGVHENMLRKWVKEFAADPEHAFPGEGQMKPEQLEIDRRRPVPAYDDALEICIADGDIIDKFATKIENCRFVGRQSARAIACGDSGDSSRINSGSEC